jgi:hypothetical protein
MFKRSNILFLVSVLAAGIMVSCEKELQEDAPAELMTNGAFVKVVHVSPNFTPISGGHPDAFNFIVSGAKVNSAALSYSSLFPGQTTGYIGLTNGMHWFKVVRPGVNTGDSITIHTFQKVLQPGQRYSYIVTDSFRSNTEARAMFLEDNFNTPVPGNYAVRFVHAVHSDTVGKVVDVYSYKRKANIFTGIKIGQATGFIELGPSGNDTLSIRRPGVTTWGSGVGELARFTGIPFSSGRVYTVIYRGLTTLTTGTKARGIQYYLNN